MQAPPITISIITPCYNGARYIRETLQSALAQTHSPLEVIVIDDGSTDNSAALAAAAGPLVRVIRQANQGESVARNRGIAEALGSHVLFLDADDLLEPESLSRLAAAVAGRPEAVAVMGCAWFRSGEAPYDRVPPRAGRFYPDIIGGNLGPPHCWLAPVDLIRDAGGFCETMRWFEDWDLWWRVGLQASELIAVPYVGAHYRQHAHSQLATTRPADRARGHVMLMTRMAAALLQRPDMLDRHAHPLFWGLWSSVKHARRRGVSWEELRPAGDMLRRVATHAAVALKGVLMANVVRLLGTRTAVALQLR